MKNKIKTKTFNIENLQAPVKFEELHDSQVSAVVGGGGTRIVSHSSYNPSTIDYDIALLITENTRY